MMENPISLVIVAVCLSAYLVHRIDVVAKKAGWIEGDK